MVQERNSEILMLYFNICLPKNGDFKGSKEKAHTNMYLQHQPAMCVCVCVRVCVCVCVFICQN